MAPLALSMPHFYQADQSFRDAIDGMKPEKEKHEFFMDVVPEFGFPLAIRPRFQLNIVINRKFYNKNDGGNCLAPKTKPQ